MAYMDKLREGTLADAIEKFASSRTDADTRVELPRVCVCMYVCLSRFARQSQQQSGAGAADGEEDGGWDHAAIAPGHSLRDFLHDNPEPPPAALPSSPPPLRGVVVVVVVVLCVCVCGCVSTLCVCVCVCVFDLMCVCYR